MSEEKETFEEARKQFYKLAWDALGEHLRTASSIEDICRPELIEWWEARKGTLPPFDEYGDVGRVVMGHYETVLLHDSGVLHEMD